MNQAGGGTRGKVKNVGGHGRKWAGRQRADFFVRERNRIF